MKIKFKEGDFVNWVFGKETWVVVEIYPKGLFRRTNKYHCIDKDNENVIFYEAELKSKVKNEKENKM